MENYNVKATRVFDDTEKGVRRTPTNNNAIFKCTKERYLFLKQNNAVELIGIDKVEEPKEEQPKEVKKPVKKGGIKNGK